VVPINLNVAHNKKNNLEGFFEVLTAVVVKILDS
jgi:hypothetical protein